LISKIIVVIQIRNEPKPKTKEVKVNFDMISKLSGPPRQIINKNKPAQRIIQARNILSVIF